MIVICDRLIDIQKEERCIGTVADNKVAHREFKITEPSLFDFEFTLETRAPNGLVDILPLHKTIYEDFIVLLWEITSNQLVYPGNLEVQIVADNIDLDKKWHTYINIFKVGESITAETAYDPLPTEFQQLRTLIVEATTIAEESAEAATTARDEIFDSLQGGATNQVLVKSSTEDFDFNWQSIGGGSGGVAYYFNTEMWEYNSGKYVITITTSDHTLGSGVFVSLIERAVDNYFEPVWYTYVRQPNGEIIIASDISFNGRAILQEAR